jgi:2-polyprenyl-3-methyl-5-hydroxy-6-metoxy-1,4-benzoquinol methylase
MTISSLPTCPACQSRDLEIFFTVFNVPIYCNLLWRNQQQAQQCPKGDIQLAFCQDCGLVTNLAFAAEKLDYSQDYENSLHYSAHFQAYADALAEQLVADYALRHKKIIEIGCGKGDFLIKLCELGQNQGVGFDSSYIPRSEHDICKEHVQFIQDFYSQKYQALEADLLCCRHVLEHIHEPVEFLKSISQALNHHRTTEIFFEVPNALHTFQNLAIWDIIYEHCLYFTPQSLQALFERAGYRVEAVTEVFGKQFLTLMAQFGGENKARTPEWHKPDLSRLKTDIATFQDKFNHRAQSWQAEIERLAHQGKRLVVWGSGSKGVTFLNLLGLKAQVPYAVDINPRKQGMYIAGTGQKIVAPEALNDYHPDVVLVMNPLYQAEIQQMLHECGLTPEIICV